MCPEVYVQNCHGALNDNALRPIFGTEDFRFAV